MKLCIIGNSHTGALKRAWDNTIGSNFKSDIEITFFAAGASKLEGLEVKDCSLVPNNEELMGFLKLSSAGLSSIDIKAYDAFLIYAANGFPYFSSNNYYSDAVIKQSIIDNYTTRLNFKLLTMIRSIVDTKIFVGHDPLRAKKNRDNIQFNSDLFSHYASGIALANKNLFFDLNCELIEQPAETITGDGRATFSRFSKGSRRLFDGSNHPINDIGHMNDDFGHIWLESFLKKLDINT